MSSEAARLGPRLEDERLVRFVTARTGEDEAAAKSATPGPWTDTGRRDVFVEQLATSAGTPADDLHLIAEMERCPEHEDRRRSDAVHIARHDPARVLREVEAKRRRLEDYRTAARDCRAGPAFHSRATYRDACYRAVLADAAVWDEHEDYEHRWKL